MEICKDCGKHIHHSDDDCWYCNVCGAPLCDECVRAKEDPEEDGEWPDWCEECLLENEFVIEIHK